MIRIHRAESQNSIPSQSYDHLKVPEVIYLLGTPLTPLRLPRNYATRPQRVQKGGASRHVHKCTLLAH